MTGLRVGVKATQEDLADAAQVTPVTVRNRIRGIVEDLNIEEVTTRQLHHE